MRDPIDVLRRVADSELREPLPVSELARRASRRRQRRAATRVVAAAASLAALGSVLIARTVDRAGTQALVTSDGTLPVTAIPEGVSTAVVDGTSLFLVRHGTGVAAFFPRNTHLGEELLWCRSDGVFYSPTHAETYTADGLAAGGPAPRGLDGAAVTMAGGHVRIDPTIVVPGLPRGPLDVSKLPVSTEAVRVAETQDVPPGFCTDHLTAPAGSRNPPTVDETRRIARDRSFPDAGPSQTGDEASRDGVAPGVAQLPFAWRVGAIAVQRAPEGRWVLSRPSAAPPRADADSSPASGTYGRDYVDPTRYGEVLLIDATANRILRAYPLPDVPPTALVLSDAAVYCGRAGDAELPDSVLCRIDRTDLSWRVRVFPPAERLARGPWPGLGPSGYVPPHWSAAPAPPPADLGMLRYRDGRLLAGADGHTVAVDPDTLDIADAGP